MQHVPALIVIDVVESVDGVSEHRILLGVGGRVHFEEVLADARSRSEVVGLHVIEDAVALKPGSLPFVDLAVQNLHVGDPRGLVVLAVPRAHSSLVWKPHRSVPRVVAVVVNGFRGVCCRNRARVSVVDILVKFILLVVVRARLSELRRLVVVEHTEIVGDRVQVVSPVDVVRVVSRDRRPGRGGVVCIHRVLGCFTDFSSFLDSRNEEREHGEATSHS